MHLQWAIPSGLNMHINQWYRLTEKRKQSNNKNEYDKVIWEYNKFSYYHRVLVLPPTHVGDPSPQIIMPTTQQMITTTTQVENDDESSS